MYIFTICQKFEKKFSNYILTSIGYAIQQFSRTIHIGETVSACFVNRQLFRLSG